MLKCVMQLFRLNIFMRNTTSKKYVILRQSKIKNLENYKAMAKRVGLISKMKRDHAETSYIHVQIRHSSLEEPTQK